MAVTIGAGLLYYGGAVVETSGGVKYAVFYDSVANTLEVWKNIDGTPSLADSDTSATVFGGGGVSFVDAAIDGASPELIHIICAGNSEQTRDIAYATFNTSTDTIGAWEQAANYTQQKAASPGVAISIDSNSKPHILFVDSVKVGGSIADNVYYTEKTGASWATPTQIGARATKTDFYGLPAITTRNSNYIEAWYYGYISDASNSCYRSYTGSWNGESKYAGGYATAHGVTSTSGGTVYRTHVDLDANVEENNVDTTYNSRGLNFPVSAILSPSDGTTRYIFFVDPDKDVHVIRNAGAGWVDEGARQVGTYWYVIAEWAYNFERQAGEINYIFDDFTLVYYDSFPLAPPPPPRIPRPPGVGGMDPILL